MTTISTNVRPLFLGGHRKSGTTMFANLFDGHPELISYPFDLTVMYAYFPVYSNKKYTRKQREKRLNQVIFKYNETNKELSRQLDLEQMKSLFWQNLAEKTLDIKSVISALITSYLKAHNHKISQSKYQIIKETSSEIYANEIFEWFPNAKFIHLIRDPRDNYAALRSGIDGYYSKFGDDNNTILHSLINRAGLGMKLAHTNQKRFGSDNYIILKFEDLVSNPEKFMKKISKDLDLKYSEKLLVPTVLGQPTQGNNFDKLNFSKISTKNVGQWKNRCSEDEAKIIEFYFSDLMELFKYNNNFSKDESADAASNFYKWSNYKYHYFDRFNEL